MFELNSYLNSLDVPSDSVELTQVKDLITLKHLIYGDAWTVRQSCYNEAWGMQSHLKYIGGSLLVNAQKRRSALDGPNIMDEQLNVSWGNAPNADQAHINDEVPVQDQIQSADEFIADLRYRMYVCAISYVLHVQEHDDISRDLEQLTFSGIQARATANRKTG